MVLLPARGVLARGVLARGVLVRPAQALLGLLPGLRLVLRNSWPSHRPRLPLVTDRFRFVYRAARCLGADPDIYTLRGRFRLPGKLGATLPPFTRPSDVEGVQLLTLRVRCPVWVSGRR